MGHMIWLRGTSAPISSRSCDAYCSLSSSPPLSVGGFPCTTHQRHVTMLRRLSNVFLHLAASRKTFLAPNSSDMSDQVGGASPSYTRLRDGWACGGHAPIDCIPGQLVYLSDPICRSWFTWHNSGSQVYIPALDKLTLTISCWHVSDVGSCSPLLVFWFLLFTMPFTSTFNGWTSLTLSILSYTKYKIYYTISLCLALRNPFLMF